jgi:succinate dehydrogenase / fumarate reductase, iron-sulfur subunit
MDCTFDIYRYDPAVDRKGRYQHYAVAAEPTDKILDCLNRIRWEQDATLAFRASCAQGVCGSDAMVINGRVALACRKLVRDFETPSRFVIEPLPVFRVIKDLIVDLRPFFKKLAAVRPHLVADNESIPRERLQTSDNQHFIEPALRCVLCAACAASCPTTRINPDYLGPAALLWAFRFIFDARDIDTFERVRKLDNANGIRGCHPIERCTEMCPQGIPVAKCVGLINRLLKSA